MKKITSLTPTKYVFVVELSEPEVCGWLGHPGKPPWLMSFMSHSLPGHVTVVFNTASSWSQCRRYSLVNIFNVYYNYSSLPYGVLCLESGPRVYYGSGHSLRWPSCPFPVWFCKVQPSLSNTSSSRKVIPAAGLIVMSSFTPSTPLLQGQRRCPFDGGFAGAERPWRLDHIITSTNGPAFHIVICQYIDSRSLCN